MKYYRREQEDEKKSAGMLGIAVTCGVHILAFLLVGYFKLGALTYLYPPPQEQAVLIEFEPEEEIVRREKSGRAPQAMEIDATKPVNLVQQAQGPHVGSKENLAKESTIGPDGDVEVPEAKREVEIDNRALFTSAKNKAQKDTLASQTSSEVTDKLKEGHAQGNAQKANPDGTPNANLKGRNSLGALPVPSYSVQAEGVIVVKIWVDQYGNVTKARAGEEGTTLMDNTLWNAARNAALKAKFTSKSDSPALQEGTITYVFRLR